MLEQRVEMTKVEKASQSSVVLDVRAPLGVSRNWESILGPHDKGLVFWAPYWGLLFMENTTDLDTSEQNSSPSVLARSGDFNAFSPWMLQVLLLNFLKRW